MRRVTMFAAGAVLTGLALAGCGAKQATSNNDGGGETLQILAANIGKSSSAKQGVHLVMSMDLSGQAIKADGDFKFGGAPAMDINYELPGIGGAKILLVDDVFYFQLPAQLQKNGKPWIKLDLNGSDQLSKTLGGALKETKKNSDPSQVLNQIKDAGEITATKQEDLNGKPTTHYSVTVDVKKAAQKVDPDLKSAMEKVAEGGVSSYPMELWVDKEGLPVRITVETPFTNPATQKVDQLKMTLDYSDWGRSVSVTAPPADQVGTFPGR